MTVIRQRSRMPPSACLGEDRDPALDGPGHGHRPEPALFSSLPKIAVL